jgi:hypothetical protein
MSEIDTKECGVPEWTRFLTVDADGTVWAWDHLPECWDGTWLPTSLERSRHGRINPTDDVARLLAGQPECALPWPITTEADHG